MPCQTPAPDLVADPSRLAFHDAQSLPLPRPILALQAWTLILTDPLPFLETAFRIRDAISARFGVQRIGGFSGAQPGELCSGDHLDFFLVERAEPQILTLTARDTHLDVMTCVTTHDQTLTITSSVITHNRFGRAYMIPVPPAHRLIVWMMLRRLDRNLKRIARC